MAAIYNLFQASFFINFDRRLSKPTVDRLTPVDDSQTEALSGVVCSQQGSYPAGPQHRHLRPLSLFLLLPSLSLTSLSRGESCSLASLLLSFLLKTHDGCARSIELPSNREYFRRPPTSSSSSETRPSRKISIRRRRRSREREHGGKSQIRASQFFLLAVVQ